MDITSIVTCNMCATNKYRQPFHSVPSLTTVVQMLSELFLFVILLNFTSIPKIACLSSNDNNNSDIIRIPRDNQIFNSMNNFFTNLKSFFGLKSKVLEEKRNRIKTAVSVFLEELKKKPETKKLGRLSDDERHWPVPAVDGSRMNYTSFLSRRVFNIWPEMNADQMIIAHGYRSESHTVLTADGYMLTMQRIITNSDVLYKRSVLIHHGLLGSADDWLILGSERALPYILVNNGYDVWLLNARGNKYSKIHINRNKERPEFWDFSWHEMGVYDLPAVIKYISEITRNAEINFIGHSMGATALLVLLSTSPEYNYILRSGVLLAPLAFMFHAKGPMRLFADFYSKNGLNSLNFLGQTKFIPNGMFPRQITEKYCKGVDLTCANPLLLLANGGREILDNNLKEKILAHVPAGGSAKTIIHYVQSVKSGFFQMFDYGTINNIRKYGNSTPPLYDLRQVTLPLAFFTSPSDWLSTVSDVQTLLPLLQHVNVHHVVKADDFDHLDFAWSQDAPELVFDFIISFLDQIRPNREHLFHV